MSWRDRAKKSFGDFGDIGEGIQNLKNQEKERKEGSKMTFIYYPHNPQNPQNRQNEGEKPKTDQGNTTSKVKNFDIEIKPIATCIHGKSCLYLYAPGKQRPICQKVDSPVFDLPVCPLDKWVYY